MEDLSYNQTLVSRSNTTSLQSHWVPEPATRGTYGILSLCLSTMLICVWNALHLDVPTKRLSFWKNIGRNFYWIMMGLLCPEVILYNAGCQLYWAHRLLKLMSDARGQKVHHSDNSTGGTRDEADSIIDNSDSEDIEALDHDAPREQSPLTLTHGFYAAMGGFAFNIPSDKGTQRFLPPDQTRLTITPNGVRFLLKHDPDLVPTLSKTSITDRSQANGLSKALLFAQVAWFCLNCFSRWKEGLSLSLLEITTIAHATCAMLSYAVWWSKPQNIEEPTLIEVREDRLRQALALMKMLSADRFYILGSLAPGLPAESSFLKKLNVTELGPEATPTSIDITGILVEVTIKEGQCISGSNFTLKPDRRHEQWADMLLKVLLASAFVPWYYEKRNTGTTVTLSPQDVNRWRYASKALDYYGMAWVPVYTIPLVRPRSSFEFCGHNFPFTLIEICVYCLPLASVLPVLYGAVHFLGWDAQFPSSTEKFIWRAATVGICASGVELSLLMAVGCLVIKPRRALINMGVLYSALEKIGEFGLAIVPILYLPCSLYLVAESFRQLYFLPPDAFVLPSSSNYLPHFS